MSTTSRLIRLADLAEPFRPRFSPPVARAIAVGGWMLYVALMLLNAWSWYTNSDGYQETHGDAKLAHPSATDCEVARAVVADIHGAGSERQLLSTFGDAKLSLETSAWAWDKSAVPPAGYRGIGGDGDWRWCPNLGRYVRSIGWVRLGNFERQASSIWLSRPAYNAVRDSAVAYEFAKPDPLSEGAVSAADRRRAFAGDLVFLKRDQHTGSWTVIGRSPAS